MPEGQLTICSTLNLHIFQTYYGGLRPSADGSTWMYDNVDLVKQFIEGGQGLKEWLEAPLFAEEGEVTVGILAATRLLRSVFYRTAAQSVADDNKYSASPAQRRGF